MAGRSPPPCTTYSPGPSTAPQRRAAARDRATAASAADVTVVAGQRGRMMPTSVESSCLASSFFDEARTIAASPPLAATLTRCPPLERLIGALGTTWTGMM